MTAASSSTPPGRVVVLGAGLIGCSIGLALRSHGDTEVVLIDPDEDRARLAGDLGAGRPAALDAIGGDSPADVAVICVPPAQTAAVLCDAQRRSLALTYSDVASIKSGPQHEAQALGADLQRFVGGHPIAGRERSGPAAARADLFLGRPWVLCPGPEAAPDAVDAVAALAIACGAAPLVLDPAGHDRAMAAVSHAPQALASAVAAALVDAEPATTRLAGSGLRDLTRIADSEPGLWAQIAAGNREPIADVLDGLTARLRTLVDHLRAGDDEAAEAFRALVEAGNRGRAELPGKHGGRAAAYALVPVVIADEPGTLARLLGDAGAAGINVEDLALEHSPGAPVGLCELVVRPQDVDRLVAVLADRGWTVHPAAQPEQPGRRAR